MIYNEALMLLDYLEGERVLAKNDLVLKKAWFDAIIAKAKRGIHSFEIDGQQIDSYEKLQDLFDQAVETDYRNFKYGGSVANYTVALKKKVFQKLLQVTDAFSSELFPKG